MIINSIQLKNFRQFKGEQPAVEFSTSKNENVTVLLGDNTSGKTTFLQSFLWCLYGRANFKTARDLLNKEVELDLLQGKIKIADIKVKIELTHLDMKYTIERTQLYSKSGSSVQEVGTQKLIVTKKEEDGTTTHLIYPDDENMIKSIFPEELSTYFLYDTERFINITEDKDLASAVKGLLGLTLYEKAIEHIGKENSTNRKTALGILYHSLEHEDLENAQKHQMELSKIEEEIQEIVEEQVEVEKNIQHLHQQSQEMREKLQDYAEARGKENQRIREEQLVKGNRESLEQKKLDMPRKLSARPENFFIKPLVQKAFSILESAQVEDVGIKDMNANSINHIIERGHCVCGTPVEKESPEYHALIREREYLPPQSIGSMIQQFQERLKSMSQNGNDYVDDVKGVHKDILKLNIEIEQSEERIKSLREDLKGIESVAALENKVQDLENKERQQRDKKIRNEERIRTLKENKGKALSKYQKSSANTEKNTMIQDKIMYLNAVSNWFGESYERQSGQLRQELEESVNNYFQEIYHGDRRVEIDDKYRVRLKVIDEVSQVQEIDGSQGLETVKNFAFLAGLADLAEKKKIKDQKNNELSAVESLPMILDAPFSNTDEKHVSNISRVLPNVSEQLILIVMQKDFTHAETVMKDRIGKKYMFKKQTETHTLIEEVDL